jgi:hypothetical protein
MVKRKSGMSNRTKQHTSRYGIKKGKSKVGLHKFKTKQ